MSKYYEKTATRWYGLELLKAWIKGEENLGLKNSIFVMDNGKITQYVDSEEGEKFYNDLKNNLTEEYFANIVMNYFQALKDKNKEKIFECLAIFNEIDEFPKIASDEILRRLERVRKQTHEEIYKLE